MPEPGPEAEERPASEPAAAAARGRFAFPTWAAVGLLLALPAGVFGNSLEGTWLLDDTIRISGNPEVERVWPPWRFFLDRTTVATQPRQQGFRPLLPLSVAVNFWIADRLDVDRRVALHVGNIVLHLVSTLLVFALFRTLLALARGSGVPEGLRDPAAFWAALLWAVHPVSGLAVNYLSARDLLLMQLFSLATLLVYARMRRRGFHLAGLLGSALCFGLAVSAKETAAALVPLLVVFELVMAPAAAPAGSPPRSRRVSLGVALGLGVAGAYWAGDRALAGFSVEYGFTQLATHLWHYGQNAVWPFQVRLLPYIESRTRLFDPAVLSGLAFVLASLGLAWRWRSRRPLLAFCILAYWALFSPTSSVIKLYELANDYRQYPPLAPLYGLFAVGVFATLRPRVAVSLTAATALYLGVASHTMNPLYRDTETYWGHVVRHGGTPLAILSYARAIEAAEPDRSEELLREALAMEPRNTFVHVNLGVLRYRRGHREEGLGLVEKAVELRPGRTGARHILAKLYRREGRLEEAVRESRQAADRALRNGEYALLTARYLIEASEFEAALTYLGRIPDYSRLHRRAVFQEGLALEGLGRFEEAEVRFRRRLAWKPRDAAARTRLGVVLAAQGRLPEAIEALEQAITRGGGHAREAQESLDAARARLSGD